MCLCIVCVSIRGHLYMYVCVHALILYVCTFVFVHECVHVVCVL